jgi:hypothetical protein
LVARERLNVVGIPSPTPLIDQAWGCARIAKRHGVVTILAGPHPMLVNQTIPILVTGAPLPR